MTILTLIFSFIITSILLLVFIPYLKRLKFGQSIREDGPESHLSKSGTPTMGGLMIVIGVLITLFILSLFSNEITLNVEFWLLTLVLLGFGLLGFLDDFIKIGFKRNLGLTSLQKLIGQIVIAIIFYGVMKQYNLGTAISIPGTDFEWELGWFYAILVIVMLVGASNAVNLTDGLDGLLAGTASVAFGAFAFILATVQTDDTMLVTFSMAIVGALLGFLIFNAHPAKIFMGDTGSLALGATIAAIAILSHLEILLVIIGGVFVIETLSVILQVASFKTTGKRIFKMSPIHHHFELGGWSEWRVVITFWFAGILFAIIGIIIEVIL
ncbi:MAG TPA: phospho-N-acetylmuramoyl-pentapeptide-transferase [Pseudogracilibacillus sp.]|nr:phospho-N-acetylmuramoyl-pentapeptide-transferase [Pseudogracilibacillus sp.]